MHGGEADRIYDGIYGSYLRAKPYFKEDDPDSIRRSPQLLSGYFGEYEAKKNLLVTGSKGKGSIARMTAALLSARYKTGLMISPHVSDYLERISIGGKNISEEAFVRIGKQALADAVRLEPEEKNGEYISPTGLWALIGMRYFSEKKTGFNVLECGKGAKYDDVNRIPHETAVIGTIFLEHQKELGDTIEEIARDKASVITRQVKRVYVMDQKPVVMDIIAERAGEMGAELCCPGKGFLAKNLRRALNGVTADIYVRELELKDVFISLAGGYQAGHAALALAVFVDHIREKYPGWKPDEIEGNRIRSAFNTVRIPGRMEVIGDDPLCVIDSCINRESAGELMATLSDAGIDRAVTIICLPDDKDVCGVADIMAKISEVMIFTKANHPHYPTKTDWGKVFTERGIRAFDEADMQIAYQKGIEFGLPIIVLVANTFVDFVEKNIESVKFF